MFHQKISIYSLRCSFWTVQCVTVVWQLNCPYWFFSHLFQVHNTSCAYLNRSLLKIVPWKRNSIWHVCFGKCVLQSSVMDRACVKSHLVLAEYSAQYFSPNYVIFCSCYLRAIALLPLELFILQIFYSVCYPFTCTEIRVDPTKKKKKISCNFAVSLFVSITQVN